MTRTRVSTKHGSKLSSEVRKRSFPLGAVTGVYFIVRVVECVGVGSRDGWLLQSVSVSDGTCDETTRIKRPEKVEALF